MGFVENLIFFVTVQKLVKIGGNKYIIVFVFAPRISSSRKSTAESVAIITEFHLCTDYLRSIFCTQRRLIWIFDRRRLMSSRPLLSTTAIALFRIRIQLLRCILINQLITTTSEPRTDNDATLMTSYVSEIDHRAPSVNPYNRPMWIRKPRPQRLMSSTIRNYRVAQKIVHKV